MAWGLWVELTRLDSSGGVGLVGLPSSFDIPHVFTADALEESRLPFVRSSHLTTKSPQPDSSMHMKGPFNQSFNQSVSARNAMEQEGGEG